MNHSLSGLPDSPVSPSEIAKLFSEMLGKVPKYWKSVAAVISLYASGSAIFGLYVYLSVIGRVDLFMPSISISPALFAWLFCATLILLGVLLCIITPAIFFASFVSLFNLPTKDAARLGSKFALLTACGFAILSVWVFYLNKEQFAWSVLVVWALGLVGVYSIVALTERQRNKYLRGFGPERWHQGKVYRRVFLASFIYVIGVFAGIYPAIIISLAHPGSATSYGALLTSALCVFWMLILFVPIINYYRTSGVLARKLSNTLLAAFFSVISFFLVSPSLFGLVAYSAASAVKLRDSQVSEYIVSKKYPKATLDPTLWLVRELDDSEKTITIRAFPLFKFGNTLLLCPAKYAGYSRDDMLSITKYCFATYNSEVTQAAPTSLPPIYLRETYCGREYTRIPLILSQRQRCVFAPSKINPKTT
ncbi:hypothetical protein [Pseudomonas asiatica]|uniref:hypothetical protein n=1 Tax=Pseudomonas asiatica TaxID=2219225 RepID=UPI001AAE8BE0|nr:hypothetical protein [Pseudomonas asiatica]MBO2892835.1 hypothetical protein [Pseudomonas asiatica]